MKLGLVFLSVFVVFLIEKLFGVIAWPWIWIFLPLIVWATIYFIALAIYGLGKYLQDAQKETL